ncbi:hypothetical protein R6Q57_006340 [Mikania cordata]
MDDERNDKWKQWDTKSIVLLRMMKDKSLANPTLKQLVNGGGSSSSSSQSPITHSGPRDQVESSDSEDRYHGGDDDVDVDDEYVSVSASS